MNAQPRFKLRFGRNKRPRRPYGEPLDFEHADPDDFNDPGMPPSRAERLTADINATRAAAARAGCTSVITRAPFDRPVYVSAVRPCRRAIILELGAAPPRCPCPACRAWRKKHEIHHAI